MMIPAGDSPPKLPGEFSRKRKSVSKGKSMETPLPAAASPSPSFSKMAERKDEEEKGGKRRERRKEKKKKDTKPPEPPKDYIHVRARRGQATNSHSLAERVRLDKIGERMKLLQDLVPGCNKFTGKALMLDFKSCFLDTPGIASTSKAWVGRSDIIGQIKGIRTTYNGATQTTQRMMITLSLESHPNVCLSVFGTSAKRLDEDLLSRGHGPKVVVATNINPKLVWVLRVMTTHSDG